MNHALKFLGLGDTTAYTTSWLMKEIYHKDNQHLNAVNRIRAEATELGFANRYLGYGDVPVCYKPKKKKTYFSIYLHYREEIAVRQCYVGRDLASQHRVSGWSNGSGR